MRLGKKNICIIISVMLMLGCSREGFKASLNRSDSSQDGSTAQNPSSASAVDALVFDIGVEESDENGVYLNYALPNATTSEAEAPAEHISEKIHAALNALRDQIVGEKDLYKLTVFDAVTKNDGVHYSVMYDIKYLVAKDAGKENYCYGLVFDSATGELVGVDSIMDAGAFVALLLDEQSSKILEKDEVLAAKKRAYLNEQGIEVLKSRLSYPDGVVSPDRLLDASFYLDGAKLVAIFAAPQDIGGVVEVSVSL